MMAVDTHGTGTLPQIKGVKDVPYDELFVSGHRTCQGCESALVMRHMVKASGPRTIVLGSTGCMYVANTTYYTTPWVDRKSTRLNSSHANISYAVFCLKKKNTWSSRDLTTSTEKHTTRIY